MKNTGKPARTVRHSHQHVRAPFPGEPRLAAPCKGIRIGPRQSPRSQNRFSRADVPPRVGVPKQLLVAVEQEQAVEQRNAGGYQRQIGQQPAPPPLLAVETRP